MQITYNLTRTDVCRALVSRLLKSRWLWLAYFGLSAYVFYIGSVQDRGLNGWIDYVAALITSLLFAVLYLAFAIPIVVFIRFLRHRDGDGVVGEHTITFSDNGFTERTAINESHYTWEGVSDVRESAHAITIDVNDCHYYPIPKRAFENSEDARAFSNKLRALHRDARSPQTS